MEASPYASAWREWDERYADLVIGKRNWQLAAGGLLVLGLILAGGMVWLSSRSKYIPYVVEVDTRIRADGARSRQRRPRSQTSRRGWNATRWRPSSARRARSPAIHRSSSRCSTPCSRMRAGRPTTSWTSTTIPTLRITPSGLHRSKPYPVQIDSILSLSAKSYQVRWTEQARDLNGAAIGAPTHWEAELETEIAARVRRSRS